jgi:hypothetical protein
MAMGGWACDFPLVFECYNCGYDGKTLLKRRIDKCFLAVFLVFCLFGYIAILIGAPLGMQIIFILAAIACNGICLIPILKRLKFSYHYCT